MLKFLPEQNRFRRARFQHFVKLIESFPSTDSPLRILDVGGTESYWFDKLPMISRSAVISLLNIRDTGASLPNFIALKGDARSMRQFANNSFDIVHSNSVIEHVGMWKDMADMASEIRRIAKCYFVQTPYYWFPIEPHSRAPFLHWLPESWRFRVVMARQLGHAWVKAETVDQAMRMIQSASILDRRMFTALFPDADIIPEKFCGLTKSLMAIKSPPL